MEAAHFEGAGLSSKRPVVVKAGNSKKLPMQIYASTCGARCVWAPTTWHFLTCAGGALRLQVPSTVQIDFFDVIFRNNTAQSSRDIWADMSQSTTINVHLICITDLLPEASNDCWCVRSTRFGKHLRYGTVMDEVSPDILFGTCGSSCADTTDVSASGCSQVGIEIRISP